MKKYILLAFWLLTFSYAQAQTNPFLQPSFQVQNRSYLCVEQGEYEIEICSSENTFSVGNGENYANNSIMPVCRWANIKREVMENNVRTVFSPQRCQNLQNEEVDIRVYLNRSTGVIKEVAFMVKRNTQITPKEIYDLENQIRSLTYSQAGLERCPDIDVDYVERGMTIHFDSL